MVSRQVNEKPEEPKHPRRPAAKTPEGREHQLIVLATDLVEKKMRAGTASSQEITHFLKLGSVREKLEQEKLRHENQFLQAKTEAMASMGRVEELMSEAILAFRGYSGQAPIPELEE